MLLKTSPIRPILPRSKCLGLEWEDAWCSLRLIIHTLTLHSPHSSSGKFSPLTVQALYKARTLYELQFFTCDDAKWLPWTPPMFSSSPSMMRTLKDFTSANNGPSIPRRAQSWNNQGTQRGIWAQLQRDSVPTQGEVIYVDTHKASSQRLTWTHFSGLGVSVLWKTGWQSHLQLLKRLTSSHSFNAKSILPSSTVALFSGYTGKGSQKTSLGCWTRSGIQGHFRNASKHA